MNMVYNNYKLIEGRIRTFTTIELLRVVANKILYLPEYMTVRDASLVVYIITELGDEDNN